MIYTGIGVPDKALEFLNFVQHVRLEREGMEEPTIVHCRYEMARYTQWVNVSVALVLV